MTKQVAAINRYRSWLKVYRATIKKKRSAKLARRLLAKNFNKKMWDIELNSCKQLLYSKKHDCVVAVSMSDRLIRVYNFKKLCNGSKKPLYEKKFDLQAVEIVLSADEDYCFITLSDFEKENKEDKLVKLSLERLSIVFTVTTNGKYSKHITLHPDNLIIVSNWRTNNLSVIDTKSNLPKLVQSLPCGIAPRGTAVTKTGDLLIAVAFRSRNVTYFQYNKSSRLFALKYISRPIFDPSYSGTLRHIVIDNHDKLAYISNLGRNLVHIWDISKKAVVKNLTVGAAPNTIALSENNKYLAVSCRESNIICIINTRNFVTETIVNTGRKPTGLYLSHLKDRFYYLFYSSFESGTISCRKIVL